jgi:tetratricopeptide (TPR) repeat protein/transglutaminase-like putative cysteine protease
MHSARPILALVASALPLACMAQAPAAPATLDPYRNESIVIERSETTYRMHADGTGERDSHVIMRIQSDGAAQQFGVLGFPYASANETLVIKFVRVHKNDGTTVETPASDAIDMPADVTRQAPLYSDLKEKHLPVRSLSPGDKLEYEVDTVINKPDSPGQFWGSDHFTPPGTAVALAELLTLEVPADKYVQVWSPNHKPTISEHDGLKTYTWSVSQLVTAPKNTGDDSTKPTPPKDPDEDDQGRKLPSVEWTTFRNWSEVGDWYRSLALKQAEPNDALRARANDLTAKAQTPEDQIRAIYDFVSSRTRYVGIDFGIGRYQPHAASEVLADQYGDCKDKDTLLEALLRAKGFTTAPALIGAGIAPVPDVPSPSMFNHVITTVNLPGGRIWLDSTPMVSPYRFLSAVIRDEKALLVPSDSPATLETTPPDGPYPYSAQLEAIGDLDADGKLTAKITATYRDDDEIIVRALERSFASAEWDKVSQYISASTGFGGATSNTDFKNTDDTSQPITLTYDYSRHPFGDWDNRRIVPLFPALEFTALDSETTAPPEDIQLGSPRTLKAVTHIHLPEGFIVELPDPIHVKTEFATFDKTYTFVKGEIIAERDIVILKKTIAKSDWKTYLTFTKDINLTGENWIQLLPPSTARATAMKPVQLPSEKDGQTGGSVSVKQLQTEQAADNKSAPVGVIPSEPSSNPAELPSNESIAELMQQAQEKTRSNDWSGAKELLDQVKAKNPDERNLWTAYALLAEKADGNYEEAKEDFRKELVAHPDSEQALSGLADAQARSGDPAGARQTLQEYFDRHPENTRLGIYLSILQSRADDNAGALKTLETATKQNPNDPYIRMQMSETLVRLNRMEEAAAAAKSALEGADDPNVLNGAAYTLSETGLDLDVAEDASRKSIAALEVKSARITTESANPSAFALTTSLANFWDTLGWILFKKGKLDAAEAFIAPAWRVTLEAGIGSHLGQIYEAEGKKNKAATVFALSQDALDKNSQPDDRREIIESIDRLKGEGAKPDSMTGTGALQDLRTFKFPHPKGASGWGAFRLEATMAGVIESQQMSGAQTLESIRPAVDAIKFPDFFPPDSQAHLLLSAVIDCSSATTCEVVLVPNGGLQTERQ